jgi:3-deoxy-D-manno-octulosonate 8-phosphate phosphatase KdsC-like HAD superfamily phosphatase
VNDLELIVRVAEAGLVAAPADAVPAVRAAVHFCTSAPGGSGAFRELADSILGWRKEQES